MENHEFLEPFSRMLEDLFPLERVREIERGGSSNEAWNGIEGSGFLDALVPEVAGGAGLSLAQTGPLLQALGYRAIPLPVGETMLARWLIANAGAQYPTGSIAFATGGTVPFGMVADHFMFEDDVGLYLVSGEKVSRQPTGAHNDLAATIELPGSEADLVMPLYGSGLLCVSALVRAAGLAGAGVRLLDMTIAYANERVQFGKPIGRQQALQQSLAVMAEDVVACRIAVELACATAMPPRMISVACAKAQASTVADRIANIAHAVHGAIGISEEHDLQLFSRRLRAWRVAAGSESYWNRLVGDAQIHSRDSVIDWMRCEVFQEQSR